ncbi:MAG TPA: SCE4755 family polysaccharide monooxygenase-like protein [Polyangiaceae bacterium]|jgi:hypothetical protein
MRFSRWLSMSVALGALAQSGVALGHIRLQYPTPRYPAPAVEDGSQLKVGPCGVPNDTRTTDPTRISTFSPGQQIVVQWVETIGHPGHYRIAFDPNGQDNLGDPTSYDDIVDPPVPPILLDGIPDVAGNASYAQPITLPNIQCNNCTLQVLQIMTDKPPYEINTNDVYHQCADIVLSGPLAASGGASGWGEAGAFNLGGAGANTGGLGAGGEPAVPIDSPQSSADSGGCSFSPRPSEASGSWALLALALFAQRRGRAASRHGSGGKLVR